MKINSITLLVLAIAMSFVAAGCSSQANSEKSAEEAAAELTKALTDAMSTEVAEPAAPPVAALSCGAGTEKAEVSKINLELCYSDKWSKGEDAELDLLLFAPLDSKVDEFQENVNVVTEGLPYSMTASGYMDASMEALRTQLQKFSQVDRGSTEIRGRAAEWIVYKHEMMGFKIEVKAWAMIKDSRAYVITGSALQDVFDKYESQFDAIAGTVQIGG